MCYDILHGYDDLSVLDDSRERELSVVGFLKRPEASTDTRRAEREAVGVSI
jgi:hypothetical protein